MATVAAREGEARLGGDSRLLEGCVFEWSWVVSALKQGDSGVSIFADHFNGEEKVFLYGYMGL